MQLKSASWLECPETGVQSQVESNQRPKKKKKILDNSLLNTQHYKVRIKSKWSNPGKGVVPFSKPRCSSYWKGKFRVTLDCGWPTDLMLRNNIKNNSFELLKQL